MKRCASVLIAVAMVCSAAGAFAENGTSEIEKVLGFASWLLGSTAKMQKRAQEEDDAYSAMMWMYNEANPAAPNDVKEIAGLLTELGIDGITAEYIGQTYDDAVRAEENGYVFSREMAALSLLCAAGMGTYDADFNWYPSSETVMCLDMELFGGETLYSSFFEGLNRICSGEFVFTDIREDYSDANLETGEGVIGLEFLVNGASYACSAVMMQDWFDMAVFDAVSDIAVDPDSGRRLYAMYDGMQGLIILYNTPEWAQRFEEATGCPLNTKMHYAY